LSADPRDILRGYLRPYQRRVINDDSRRMIILKARQIGISTCLVIIAILTALSRSRHDVYLCSTSLDNAKDLLRRCKSWLRKFELAGLRLPTKKQSATVVEFWNGSRIIAKPALSIRSRSGTIILDEFAIQQHDREIWKGVAPAIEARPDLRVIVCSTPFGASGVFHRIYTDPDGIYADWSRHEIDIYQAAEEGFPGDPAEMEKRYTPDEWRQEFCCEFLSDVDQYFSYDLIRRSQYAPEDLPDEGKHFAGIDLASRAHKSALADLLDTSSAYWLERVHTLKEAGTEKDYSDQFDEATELLQARVFNGVAVDATGEGAEFGQNLRRLYGRRLVHEVKGGQWSDVFEHVPKLHLAMENNTFRIPNDRDIRSAFSKISKKHTTGKKVSFKAAEDGSGHADEFFASLLAYYAAEQTKKGTPNGPIRKVGNMPSRRTSKGW
jgi:phage FluMu gp28-like protein